MIPIFQKALVDKKGNVLPFCGLTVTRESDSAQQPLYSSNDGSGFAAEDGNYTTGVDGIATFYIPPGIYKMVQTSASGLTQTWRYWHIPKLDAIIDESSTSRIATVVDLGNFIVWDSASAAVYELDNSVFDIGNVVTLHQEGAGQILIHPTTGMNLRVPSGGTNLTNGQGAAVEVKKRADNEFILLGHTVAA